MQSLAAELEEIEGIGSAIYEDDIALWCYGGSDGHVENALQEMAHLCLFHFMPTVHVYFNYEVVHCFPAIYTDIS